MNAFAWMAGRAQEPSSAAGLALILNAIPALLANPRDAQAWGSVIGGLIAVVRSEKARP